eukprot:m.207028 g.207028  ORF g.207028 m.207028 type:complete len:479 (-) comp18510_c0_seq8:61-1497(-)
MTCRMSFMRRLIVGLILPRRITKLRGTFSASSGAVCLCVCFLRRRLPMLSMCEWCVHVLATNVTTLLILVLSRHGTKRCGRCCTRDPRGFDNLTSAWRLHTASIDVNIGPSLSPKPKKTNASLFLLLPLEEVVAAMTAMNAFTDLTDEEQIIDLVEYTGTLLENGQEFVKTNRAALNEGRPADVLRQLIQSCHVYFVGPQEIESTFNSMARLLRVELFKPVADELVRNLAAALASPEVKGHELSRLKVLGNLFNNLAPTSSSRYDTYLQVVSLAGRSDNVRSILAQLGQLDGWMKEWQVDVAQQRVLQKKLHEVLAAGGLRKQSTEFLEKYLRSFDGTTAEELASVRPDVELLVKEVLSAEEELFEGSALLELSAVKQLKGSDIYEVLDKYVAGDLPGLDAWLATHAAAIQSIGFQQDELRRKVQLSTLTKMCSENSVLEFSEIATQLKVPEDDIETWMIDGQNLGQTPNRWRGVDCA